MSTSYRIDTDSAALGLARQFHAALGSLQEGRFSDGTRVEIGIGTTVKDILSACYDLIREEEAGYTICTFSRHNSTRNDIFMLKTMRSIAKEVESLPRTSVLLLTPLAGEYLQLIGAKLKKEKVLPENATTGEVFMIATRCMRLIQSRMIEKEEKLGIFKPAQGVRGRVFADINFGI